jgi:large subunit ribosomal protein L17
MRHAKHTFKIGRTGSHNRCLIANMLKSLVQHGRIETSITKAKELRRHADKLITLAKKNTLASRRLAIGRMMVRFNSLTPKEEKKAKKGDLSSYNGDRVVVNKLFGELRERFQSRNGGYTRIIKTGFGVGDQSPKCYIEYLQE